MRVQDKHYRTIWLSEEDSQIVQIIDQRHLPHHFVIENLTTVEDVAEAISDMHVRGAGLIGATAGYGMYLAALKAQHSTSRVDFLASLERAGEQLKATRPTAINLAWAVQRQLNRLESADEEVNALVQLSRELAGEIADRTSSYVVDILGHVAILYRQHPDAEKRKIDLPRKE